MTTDSIEEHEPTGTAEAESRRERGARRAGAITAALRAEAECLGQRQAERAARRLDARGDLEPEQRAALEELATTIAAELVATPAAAIRESDDPDVLQAAVGLFDLDTGANEPPTAGSGRLEVTCDDD